MAVVRSHQKSVSVKSPAPSGNDDHQGQPIQVLGFGIGNDQYGIEIQEAMDVIRDLMMIQSSTPRSVTRQFIRRNRGNAIVLNLEECLTIQWGGGTDRKKTSFLMLDERILDSCVGILGPGVPEVRNQVFTRVRAGRGLKTGHKTPLRGVSTGTRTNARKKGRNKTSLIDLRELVENCITTLKFMDPHLMAVN
jgi:hypothetical protein